MGKILLLVLSSSIDTEEGDYMFCFDNTFSSVSEKLIFFELILDNMDTDEDPDDWKEYVHGTDILDMKLEDIMVRVGLVWINLTHSKPVVLIDLNVWALNLNSTDRW